MIQEHNEHKPQIPESCFVHDSAVVIGNVTLGEKCNIWPGAVIRGDVSFIKVGEECSIQDNVVVHCSKGCPTVLGNQVIVGHGCILHGCKISDNAVVGMGATVMDGVEIGKGAVVAAGAVVLENTIVKDLELCAGVPAKLVKKVENMSLNERLLEEYRQTMEEYL